MPVDRFPPQSRGAWERSGQKLHRHYERQALGGGQPRVYYHRAQT